MERTSTGTGSSHLEKCVGTNRYTVTNETFRTERSEENIQVRSGRVGLVKMMFCDTSNSACWVTSLGRTTVLEILSSSPGSSLRTRFNSTKTSHHFFWILIIEVKREIKRICMNGCRHNERLNAKTEGSKRVVYTGLRG